MQSKNVVVGEYYRLSSSPDYGWIKVLQVLRPGDYDYPTGAKNKRKILVKVEHTAHKNHITGFIRYFSLNDILPNTR